MSLLNNTSFSIFIKSRTILQHFIIDIPDDVITIMQYIVVAIAIIATAKYFAESVIHIPEVLSVCFRVLSDARHNFVTPKVDSSLQDRLFVDNNLTGGLGFERNFGAASVGKW